MTRSVTERALRLAPALVGVVVMATACASDARQTTLKPKGPKAESINTLINPIFAVSGIVFVLILGGALFIARKFRARDDTDYDDFPEQVHGNFRLEIGWSILPALVLLVVGVFTVVGVFDLARKPGPEALNVEVIGQQWWWEYRYDLDGDGSYDEVVTANDLVIPAGREVSLQITSRDVIHSFWVPALNGKKDAVPGRRHPLTMEADEPGEYIGQCTEFCGLSHAEMRIKVVALTSEEFDTWTEGQQAPFENPTGTAAQAGWSAFAGQCTTCHRIDDMTDPASGGEDPVEADEPFEYDDVVAQVSGAAPNLTHFMSRTTFAGAKFDLRKPTEECEALGEDWASTEEGVERCLNRASLEAWLRNPPAEKAMAAGDAATAGSRGMPNLNLSEDQIDDLVAFLITLK